MRAYFVFVVFYRDIVDVRKAMAPLAPLLSTTRVA
jgi:hypothetical protein